MAISELNILGENNNVEVDSSSEKADTRAKRGSGNLNWRKCKYQCRNSSGKERLEKDTRPGQLLEGIA
jgi:hypothetical protein